MHGERYGRRPSGGVGRRVRDGSRLTRIISVDTGSLDDRFLREVITPRGEGVRGESVMRLLPGAWRVAMRERGMRIGLRLRKGGSRLWLNNRSELEPSRVM